MLAGGLRNGLQSFSPKIAGSNAALLVLAAVGLFIPGVFAASGLESEGVRVEESVLVALVLIVGYGLSLVWQFTNPDRTLGGHEASEGHGGPAWTMRTAVVVLLVTAAALALLSEILVGSIEPFIEQFGLSELFVGVILIPTIGNLAEHLVAVQLAVKNKMEFALAVSFGSSLQVALFVAPVLVLLGVVVGQPMDLVFQPLEIAAVAAAVGISALVALDGESNWLEGALLVLVYLDHRRLLLRAPAAGPPALTGDRRPVARGTFDRAFFAAGGGSRIRPRRPPRGALPPPRLRRRPAATENPLSSAIGSVASGATPAASACASSACAAVSAR